jgi:hypothetical protein
MFTAILGFHSMMNQDQYHASLLSKGQPIGLGWDGITKASQPKPYPAEPPNMTDPDKTIKQVQDDDHTLVDLNWNNIKVLISILCLCVSYLEILSLKYTKEYISCFIWV